MNLLGSMLDMSCCFKPHWFLDLENMLIPFRSGGVANVSIDNVSINGSGFLRGVGRRIVCVVGVNADHRIGRRHCPEVSDPELRRQQGIHQNWEKALDGLVDGGHMSGCMQMCAGSMERGGRESTTLFFVSISSI